MRDVPLWIALSLTGHVGSKTLRALINHFGDDPAVILAADAESLQAVPGVGPKIAASIQNIDLPQVEQALDEWADDQVSITTFIDPNAFYPRRLHAIDDAPATLFMLGSWQAAYDSAIAIVGTRTPSPDAEKITTELGTQLAQNKFTIVSGLANGIDTLAHKAALNVPHGTTIAVLGCGVLNIYPAENHKLAARCAVRGVVMSEVAPSAPPSGPRLVARNRIISGLSQAVIVVETDVDGGAMHAARRAQQQGRTVVAVDLPASGNQALLAAGALPIQPDLADFDSILAAIHEG